MCLHGWDVILGASTGSGKTLPIELMALAMPERTIVVVCPLLSLEAAHVARFKDTEIKAVSMHQMMNERVNSSLVSSPSGSEIQRLRREHIRENLIFKTPNIVFASPESILLNPATQTVLREERFRNRVCALVVDEVDTVETWGIKVSKGSETAFRPAFSQIQTIRERIGGHLPLLALSATLPSSTIETVLPLLGFGHKHLAAIDAGVDRPNISYGVRTMRHSISSYLDLQDLFRLPTTPTAATSVPKTIIYMNTRAGAYAAAFVLQAHFARHGHANIVRPFTALTSTSLKMQTLSRDFQPGGHLRVMVATEAGGMGIDFPDVDMVVQFQIPGTALDLAQHWGRVIRNPKGTGVAIMFAQPWSTPPQPAVETNKRTKTQIQEAARREALDPGLRRITAGVECVRKVLVESTGLDVGRIPAMFPTFTQVTDGL
ncbi:hypothetical protein CF336_g9101 [Tilletia laevis]|nr:hypothetical protein CF336_g9101 [Tilletia laevis]